MAATLLLAACQDEARCERCTFQFSWDSEGNYLETNESCDGIDCAEARCGSCFDLTYTHDGMPQSGTCDRCSEEADRCPPEDQPERSAYCRNAGGNHCVDLETNPEHCGECDLECAEEQVCQGGQCVCPVSQERFCTDAATGGQCYDVTSDPGHCGDCETVCGEGQTCNGGRCS